MQPAGEQLWSNTFVPLRKWTHVAACAEGQIMRLFINALLQRTSPVRHTPAHTPTHTASHTDTQTDHQSSDEGM